MNVSQLIKLISNLSIGDFDITPEERETYLSYLNMANMEMYKIAASNLATIAVEIDIFINDDGKSFNLPEDFCVVRDIFVGSKPMEQAFLKKAAAIPLDQYLVLGRKIYFNNVSSQLQFPVKNNPDTGEDSKYITMFYAPNPKTLVEDVQDAATETNTPVYPILFHHKLAFGALYFFYFPEKVFLEKMGFVDKLCMESKRELAAYSQFSLK